MADIEVVIKVDERDVDFVRKNFKPTGYSFIPLQIQNELISAILNGTILPKGHGRLKDIDWIDDNCENHYSDKDGSWCYRWKDIEGAPTIIDADKESEA